MLFQNDAEKLIKIPLGHKFIACVPAGKRGGKAVHNGQDGGTVFGEQRVYGDFVVHNVAYGF